MANDTFSFSSPDDQETAVLQPVAADGLFAAAATGTATPQQSDNGTNNHADNTAYVGEHVMASTTAKSHGKAARIAIITIFAVLLAALIAYFFVGRWYFQDKAAPGVHLGNVSVMGQTREELANTVKQQLNNTTVTFTAEGNSVKASLKDLGVTVDTDKTVDALLNAKTGDVAKLNIFDQPHIALTATTDKETAEQFAPPAWSMRPTERRLPPLSTTRAPNSSTTPRVRTARAGYQCCQCCSQGGRRDPGRKCDCAGQATDRKESD